MKSSAKKVELASVDDLFTTEQERQQAGEERVVCIPLSQLHYFKGYLGALLANIFLHQENSSLHKPSG